MPQASSSTAPTTQGRAGTKRVAVNRAIKITLSSRKISGYDKRAFYAQYNGQRSRASGGILFQVYQRVRQI